MCETVNQNIPCRELLVQLFSTVSFAPGQRVDIWLSRNIFLPKFYKKNHYRMIQWLDTLKFLYV